MTSKQTALIQRTPGSTLRLADVLPFEGQPQMSRCRLRTM